MFTLKYAYTILIHLMRHRPPTRNSDWPVRPALRERTSPRPSRTTARRASSYFTTRGLECPFSYNLRPSRTTQQLLSFAFFSPRLWAVLYCCLPPFLYIRPCSTCSPMVSSPPPPPHRTHPTRLPVLPGPLCAQPGLRGSGEAGFSFS